MNVFFTIIHIFGVVIMVFSGLMSTCLVTSKIAEDGATTAFFQGTLITLLSGALMFMLTRRSPKKVSRKAGFLLVTMCWSLASAFCTMPLLLYFPGLSFG